MNTRVNRAFTLSALLNNFASCGAYVPKSCICYNSFVLASSALSPNSSNPFLRLYCWINITPNRCSISRGQCKKLASYCRYPIIFEIRAPLKKTLRQIIFWSSHFQNDRPPKKRWEGTSNRLQIANSNYIIMHNHHPLHTMVWIPLLEMGGGDSSLVQMQSLCTFAILELHPQHLCWCNSYHSVPLIIR